MKYFTPDLIRRSNSLDDDIADQAMADWERALVRCRRRQQKIKVQFPVSVQRFVNSHVCLHDAQVLSMGMEGETFVMVLEREPPSQDTVFLTFTLVAKPEIDRMALADPTESSFVTWMYEEFDLDRRKNCSLEVLLSNGWLVKLRFRDFQYRIVQTIFSVTNRQPLQVPSKAVPQSA